jgi:retron-type reverse transcriptase
VLDLDVRAFFDSVPHSLLLKAVAHHTGERWVLLYISRWLKAPMQMPDGTVIAREKGTPQGSLCSAEHKPPYEQRWVMRSVGGSPLVGAVVTTGHCA